ncbi:hypothetical protein PIB30_051189 [Stylosanthes scabra]|uniref:Uncharacterized protein n=1 Tax=Stylosanthes scabra TaxID=79078 RepID=A0ABU6WHS9_9FABA|nr:hypothetical protein [Stylosanthes scabra]
MVSTFHTRRTSKRKRSNSKKSLLTFHTRRTDMARGRSRHGGAAEKGGAAAKGEQQRRADQQRRAKANTGRALATAMEPVRRRNTEVAEEHDVAKAEAEVATRRRNRSGPPGTEAATCNLRGGAVPLLLLLSDLKKSPISNPKRS